MKKNLLSLFAVAIVLCGLSIGAGDVHAGDRGPQRVRASLPLGTGAITPVPGGGTGRFTPTYLTVACATGETQTISYVALVSTNVFQVLTNGTTNVASYVAVTNTCGVMIPSAASHTLAFTNVPPLFAGDKFVIVGSNTATTNACVLVGSLFD